VGLWAAVGQADLREVDGADRSTGVDVVNDLVRDIYADCRLRLFGGATWRRARKKSALRVSTRRYLWRISGASIGGEGGLPMCGVRSVLGQPRKSHSQLSETLPGSMSCGYTSTYAPA
jgi:hypothetical protein